MSGPGDGRGGDADTDDAVGWLGDVEWSEEPPGDAAPESEADRAGPDRGDPTGDASDAGDPDASVDRINAALSEVRREVRKAAALHAAAEAALVAVVAAVALSVVTPAAVSGAVGLPVVVFETLRSLPAVGAVAPRTVRVSALVATGIGVVAFVPAYRLRLRRPLIEQFEAANPPVREALRTARDAVAGGSDTEMTRRLYADVIATLRETSSLELVGTRRLLVTVLLVAVVAAAGVQIAVVDPDLGGMVPGGDGGDPGVQRPDDDDSDLQDGEEILGDAEDVEAGDDVENVTVPGTGEGGGDGPTAPGVGTGGGGGTGEFDSQQAGFAGDDRIEDAELVREYNLLIREFDGDDGTESDDDTT